MNLDSVLKATGGCKGCAMFSCINEEEGMLTFCHSCLAVLAAYLACSTLVVCGQQWSGSPCGCQSLRRGRRTEKLESRTKEGE